MQSDAGELDAVSNDITQLLRQWQSGVEGAREHLVELAYHQIRAIARGVARNDPQATLSPTELAHEALIRLLGAKASWEDRKHFYNVVAQVTRQILVDAARHRQRDKRGGGKAAESLSAADQVPITEDENLLRVNEAIEQLIARDSRSAQIIELTYFGGMERAEIAQMLGVSIPTVDRDLRFGRAWLKRALDA